MIKMRWYQRGNIFNQGRRKMYIMSGFIKSHTRDATTYSLIGNGDYR